MVLLAIPAALLTLVTVAAFFGGSSWVLDVLANFRVQYGVALTFCAIFLYLARWPRMGTVALVGVLVNAGVIVPLYLGGSEGAEEMERLRVLSFNLLSDNQQFGEVIGFIRETDPDVVFLHEASRPWEMALEAAQLEYEVTRSRSEELIFGTLVLSRPGDEVTSYGFTLRGARAVEVIHDGIAVLGFHPLAPTTAERSAIRNAQFEFVADWSNRREGPHVIAGDFNASPWSYPFRRLLAETDLVNSQRGYGIQATFPADDLFLIRVPIDHLVHSPDLEVVERRLGPRLGSDHLPLIVDLAATGG